MVNIVIQTPHSVLCDVPVTFIENYGTVNMNNVTINSNYDETIYRDWSFMVAGTLTVYDK